MSEPERKFLDGLMEGFYLLEEIDDFVEEWHESAGAGQELHEFLGMTWQEYSLWANDPDTLSDIADARRRNVSLTQAVNDNLRSERKLAARSSKAAKIAHLQNWIDAQLKRNS